MHTRSRRRYHSSAQSKEKILLIGGWDSRSTEWIPVDGSPSQPGPFDVRHEYRHCTIQLSADLIVVTGGYETFDFVTEYQLTGNGNETPLTSMRQGRLGHACAVYQDVAGQQVIIVLVFVIVIVFVFVFVIVIVIVFVFVCLTPVLFTRM